jgi:molybdate transport system substrate-binding protein
LVDRGLSARRHGAARGRLLRIAALACLLVTLPVQAENLRIAVAANFRITLDRLIEAYGAQHDDTLQASYGATGLLYAQIVQGAPFDLFFAADDERPRRLEADGLIVPASRFTYAVGRLALWRPGRREGTSLRDELTHEIATLAIANPATAPYGVAAQQVLARLGLLDAPPFRIVRGESLGQTFQFVSTGNAAAGFVALSQLIAFDAASGGGVRAEAIVVDADLHAPIVQDAVWLARARSNAAARDFLAFVRGEDGRRIIAAAGYGLPAVY